MTLLLCLSYLWPPPHHSSLQIEETCPSRVGFLYLTPLQPPPFPLNMKNMSHRMCFSCLVPPYSSLPFKHEKYIIQGHISHVWCLPLSSLLLKHKKCTITVHFCVHCISVRVRSGPGNQVNSKMPVFDRTPCLYTVQEAVLGQRAEGRGCAKI